LLRFFALLPTFFTYYCNWYVSSNDRVIHWPYGFNLSNLLGKYIAHLRQDCHNSKFRIFELFVEKETFVDVLLTGIVSKRSLLNSPLESSCVVLALIAKLQHFKTFKSLSWKITHFVLWHCCDSVVTVLSQMNHIIYHLFIQSYYVHMDNIYLWTIWSCCLYVFYEYYYHNIFYQCICGFIPL
jgi:hypothetical protein